MTQHNAPPDNEEFVEGEPHMMVAETHEKTGGKALYAAILIIIILAVLIAFFVIA